MHARPFPRTRHHTDLDGEPVFPTIPIDIPAQADPPVGEGIPPLGVGAADQIAVPFGAPGVPAAPELSVAENPVNGEPIGPTVPVPGPLASHEQTLAGADDLAEVPIDHGVVPDDQIMEWAEFGAPVDHAQPLPAPNDPTTEAVPPLAVPAQLPMDLPGTLPPALNLNGAQTEPPALPALAPTPTPAPAPAPPLNLNLPVPAQANPPPAPADLNAPPAQQNFEFNINANNELNITLNFFVGPGPNNGNIAQAIFQQVQNATLQVVNMLPLTIPTTTSAAEDLDEDMIWDEPTEDPIEPDDAFFAEGPPGLENMFGQPMDMEAVIIEPAPAVPHNQPAQNNGVGGGAGPAPPAAAGAGAIFAPGVLPFGLGALFGQLPNQMVPPPAGNPAPVPFGPVPPPAAAQNQPPNPGANDPAGGNPIPPGFAFPPPFMNNQAQFFVVNPLPLPPPPAALAGPAPPPGGPVPAPPIGGPGAIPDPHAAPAPAPGNPQFPLFQHIFGNQFLQPNLEQIRARERETRKRIDAFQREQATDEKAVLALWSAYCPGLHRVTFQMNPDRHVVWKRRGQTWKPSYTPSPNSNGTSTSGSRRQRSNEQPALHI